LLQAVVPVRQAFVPLLLHGIEKRPPGRAVLEAVDRIDVVEQKRQIEDLQFLGELVELRQ
jgi:hypothetical protein